MQCLEATKERFSMRSKKLLHKSFRFPGPWLLHGPTTGGRLCKALLTLFQLSSASIQVFEKKKKTFELLAPIFTFSSESCVKIENLGSFKFQNSGTT